MQSMIYIIRNVRSYALAYRAMSSAVSINATPSKTRIDEHIHLTISGLNSRQKVTLSSHLIEAKKVWTSHAHYTATEDGQIDTMKAYSEGGVYKGIDPMALFWNISVRDKPHAELSHKDVASPLVTNISVLPGHIGLKEILLEKPLAKTTVERGYMADGMQRIPIREGRVRGTLFIPKGPSTRKYPGILDLQGANGGIREARAALLASHGYITFALAFSNYDDLPTTYDTIPLEYFEESIDCLNAHPQVMSNNIGIIGISKGGQLALSISTLTDKVKALVCINNALYVTMNNSYKGRKIPSVLHDMSLVKMEDGDLVMEDNFDKVPNIEECSVAVEKTNSDGILLIYGADDRLVRPENGIRILKRLLDHGINIAELHMYQGAGHLIVPRYMPVTAKGFNKILGTTLLFGGKLVEHARAQSDSWETILQFFNKILRSPYAHN